MLSSASLRLSARRRDLLRFLVEETLEGRSDRLKGFTVATARLRPRRELRRQLRPGGAAGGAAAAQRPRQLLCRRRQPRSGADHHSQGRLRPALRVAGRARAAAERAPCPPGGGSRRRRRRGRCSASGGRSRTGVAPCSSPRRSSSSPPVAWACLRDRLAAGGGARGPSLIVLPFAALSPDADDRFLAAGMTQEVIAQLMRFPDVRLFSTPGELRAEPGRRSRASSAAGSAPPTWCRGAIRSEDSLVHVRAMLTDAETGEVLWNGTYDRPLSPGDIFTVQEEISSEISTTLGQPYGVLPAARPAGRRSRACRATPACCSAYALPADLRRGQFAPDASPASRRRWRAIPTMPTPGRCSAGCISTPAGSTSCRTGPGPTSWRWRTPPAPSASTRTTCWPCEGATPGPARGSPAAVPGDAPRRRYGSRPRGRAGVPGEVDHLRGRALTRFVRRCPRVAGRPAVLATAGLPLSGRGLLIS